MPKTTRQPKWLVKFTYEDNVFYRMFKIEKAMKNELEERSKYTRGFQNLVKYEVFEIDNLIPTETWNREEDK